MDPISSILCSIHYLPPLLHWLLPFSFRTSLSSSNLQSTQKSFSPPAPLCRFLPFSLPYWLLSFPSLLSSSSPPQPNDLTFPFYFFIRQDRLKPLGHGFCSSHSMKMQLIKFTDSFLEAKSNGYFSALDLLCSSAMWLCRSPLLNAVSSLGFHIMDLFCFSFFLWYLFLSVC